MNKLVALLLLGMFVLFALPTMANASGCGSAGACGLKLAKCASVDCAPSCKAAICDKSKDCKDCGCEEQCKGVSCCAK